jgi:hypothetical protein
VRDTTRPLFLFKSFKVKSEEDSKKGFCGFLALRVSLDWKILLFCGVEEDSVEA